MKSEISPQRKNATRDVVLIVRPDMTRILTAVPSLSAPDCADGLVQEPLLKCLQHGCRAQPAFTRGSSVTVAKLWLNSLTPLSQFSMSEMG